MTYEQHASMARARARQLGLADCIHYAPEATRRADALYALAKKAYEEHGIHYWEPGPGLPQGGPSPYLLEDGRMVVACATIWFFEPKAVTT